MGLIGRMLKLETEKVKAAFRARKERQDLNLPLDIRIGSTVEFDQSDFILGGDQMEFVPPQGRCLCRGYSKLFFGGYNYFRFYLQDDAEPKRDFVLQVGMDEGKPVEFIIYQLYLNPELCPEGEIYPATSEEWSTWIDDESGLIGSQYFEIPSGTQYDRVLIPEEAHRITPLEYTEVAAFDEFAIPDTIAKLCGMTYGRTITIDGIETKEFALPEKHEDNDGAFVAVLIGMELPATSIQVL